MNNKKSVNFLIMLFGISTILSITKTNCMQQSDFPKTLFTKNLLNHIKKEYKEPIISKRDFENLLFACAFPALINVLSLNPFYPYGKDLMYAYILYTGFVIMILTMLINGKIIELNEFMKNKKIRAQKAIKNRQLDDDCKECSICLNTGDEPLYSNSNVECPHLYHKTCLQKWLNTPSNLNKTTCCLCYQPLKKLLLKNDLQKIVIIKEEDIKEHKKAI